MSAPVLAEKQCSACGEVKPLSEFHRHRRRSDGHDTRCKGCVLAAIAESNARLREEMGEERYLAYKAAIVQRSRRRTGGQADRAYNAARNAATAALIERHRTEYDHLLTLARRGELPAQSEAAEEAS